MGSSVGPMPLLEPSTPGLGEERERGREYCDCGEGWEQLNPSPCKAFSKEKMDAAPRRRKAGRKPKQSTATRFPHSSHSPCDQRGGDFILSFTFSLFALGVIHL